MGAPHLGVADFLAGVVAAEGTFTAAVDGMRVDGSPRRSFTFAVALGAVDVVTVDLLRDVLGVGRVRHHPRRKAHYDDEVVFAVRALRELVDVVVPFMDAHLPASYKRMQYEAWRAELVGYVSARQSTTGTSRQRRSRS